MSLQRIITTVCFLTIFNPKVFGGKNGDCFTALQKQQCSLCNSSVAICETSSEFIPRGIPASIEKLTLVYDGDPITITPNHFKPFKNLWHINISGPIEGIEEGSFHHMVNISFLVIDGGNLSSLPDKLFADNSSLKELVLSNNNFHSLPMNVFYQLSNLEHLSIQHNPLRNICIDPTDGIGKEFSHLRSLKTLSMSHIEVQDGCVINLNSNLFKHVAQIEALTLTQTDFFRRSLAVLTGLKQLQYLDISATRRFAACPKEAEGLFATLPHTLTALRLRRWRTFLSPNFLCPLNATHLSGLKELPRLRYLDFKYSDMVLGYTISADLFDGFHALEHLHLGWCRINAIDSAAFDNCPHLHDLVLDGNPLGPRQFQLYSKESLSARILKTLSIKRALVSSDHLIAYDASILLQNAPHIEELDLSNNFLNHIPQLVCGSPSLYLCSCNYTGHNLSKLALDYNYLSTLQPSGIVTKYHKLVYDDPLQHCRMLPNMKGFSVRHNRLTKIVGLCPTLTHLYLEDNLLVVDWTANSKVIKSLASLEVLDLSSNGLVSLPGDLLHNMTKLTVISLAGNNLTYLPQSLFTYNNHLESVNLKDNNITVVDNWYTTFSRNLKDLDLSDNSLAGLDLDFINWVERSNLEVLALIGNKFACRCDDNDMQKLLSGTRAEKVPSASRITCYDPIRRKHFRIFSFKQSEWDCKNQYIVTYTVGAIVACLVSICLVLPCYKYRWFVKHPKMVSRAVLSQLHELKYEHRCQYDAFVLYDGHNADDQKWIVEMLIPSVEKQGLKLFIEDRDLCPGTPKHTGRCEALDTSRKIIVVISNSYLQSSSCLGEADLAGLYMFGNEFYQPNRILVLVREELNEDFIKQPISSLLLQNVLMAKDGDQRKMLKTLQKVGQFLSRPEYVHQKSRKKSMQTD